MTTAEIEYVPVTVPKSESRRDRKSNAGRKSNEERARLAAQAEAEERRAEIESKRAKRQQPDTTFTQILSLTIAGIVIATAFTVSYATMVAVAEWMKLPYSVGWLIYVVPGFIELLVVFSTLDYIVERSRGKTGRGPLVATIGLSAVAVLGNASHSIRAWGSGFGYPHWESIIGVALSALAPLVVLYVAKRLSALVFVDGEA